MRVVTTARVSRVLTNPAQLFDNALRVAMPKVLREADRHFREHERRLFQTEGSHGGGRWAPLSPAYALAKARKLAGIRRQRRRLARDLRALPEAYRKGAVLPAIGANKILQLTGALKRSFTGAGPGHVAVAREHGDHWLLRLGSSLTTAQYADEEGRHRPRRNPRKHTDEQVRQYEPVIMRALLPFLKRLFRDAARARWTLR